MSDPGPPCIVILAAPSGSGKTSLANRLLAEIPSLKFSVSATTRLPRKHEEHGVHYHFMSMAEFDQRLAHHDLLEAQEVYPGCWYGTLRSEVLKSNRAAPVLLDVDVEGALNVKREYGKRALSVFIQPPSLDELKKRLVARGTETKAALKARINKAERELTYSDLFDHIVINDDLDRASSELLQLVKRFIDEC